MSAEDAEEMNAVFDECSLIASKIHKTLCKQDDVKEDARNTVSRAEVVDAIQKQVETYDKLSEIQEEIRTFPYFTAPWGERYSRHPEYKREHTQHETAQNGLYVTSLTHF
ncbi:hypothetical protein DPSP01_005012 [Paraphaeosphaeria sporulosa]